MRPFGPALGEKEGEEAMPVGAGGTIVSRA